jgi:hypothetical protein
MNTLVFLAGAGAAFAFCFVALLFFVYAARKQSANMKEQFETTRELLTTANQLRWRNADSLERIAASLDRKTAA